VSSAILGLGALLLTLKSWRGAVIARYLFGFYMAIEARNLPGMTQAEVARRLGISRIRVLQIERRALRKLKARLLQRYPEIVEDMRALWSY
jgi:DNA-directed RNA polymerase sigma subunit (sigma70/sigma32)